MDRHSETQEVLKAVFEPRGMHVERLPSSAGEQPKPPSQRPDLIIIDSELGESLPHGGPEWDGVPRVIIGQARLPVAARGSGNCRYLCKPFQYGELIRAVENLLQSSPHRSA
jgi:DNA-binding response OmpR family regulator